MTQISPAWAQELLDGAQPGPWVYNRPIVETDGGRGQLTAADPEYGVIDEGDGPLVAAAPELAQTVAGMRYEYAVQVSNDGGESWRFAHGGTKSTLDPIDPCWWFRTEEEARDFAKFRTTKRSSARVVRRLVTDVEVIE